MAVKHKIVKDGSYVWLQSEMDGGLVTSTVLYPTTMPEAQQKAVLEGLGRLFNVEYNTLERPPIFFNFNKPEDLSKISWIKHLRLNTKLPNGEYIDLFTAKTLVEHFGVMTDHKAHSSSSFFDWDVNIEAMVAFMNANQDLIQLGYEGRDRFKRLMASL